MSKCPPCHKDAARVAMDCHFTNLLQASACLLWLLLLLQCQPTAAVTLTFKETVVKSVPGHYPGSYCTFTNVVLNTRAPVFLYNSQKDLHSACDGVTDVWPFMNDGRMTRHHCDEVYDVGHVFTVYYWYGSNYYHLHYDLLIPLYAHLYHNKDHPLSQRAVFMPSVESSRLQAVDWNTKAFHDDKAYWVEIAKFIAGRHTFLPMDKKLRASGKNICFKKVNFGIPTANFKDKDMIRGFVDFVKKKFDEDYHWKFNPNPKIGIITRSNRRRILNEQELIDVMKEDIEVELVKLDGMTFKEQVTKMSEYWVLVGVNGAGLMNALYLPEHSVAVQLVPYKARLNHVQYGELLKARGLYLEWHNTHENLHRPTEADPNVNRPDTIVHVQEFKELMRKAMEMSGKELEKVTQRLHESMSHDEL